MIRVAVVDDHRAVRMGLQASLACQPDMHPVGAAACAADADALVARTRPHVVVLDYRLGDEDGLAVCRRLKRRPAAPRVLLHSAFADAWLAVPAIVAGVDGIVPKGAPGRELAAAIRSLALGTALPPAVDAEVLAAVSESLAPEERELLSMLIRGAREREVGAALGIERDGLERRLDRMLDALRAVRAPA